MPEMTDPLGAPTVVTGAQYMDALARLGYNVENMSSSLPMYTKAAQAATSLMDQAYNQRMEWDKAQAAIKLSVANANHIDSETDYNNRSMDNRLKELDLNNRQKEIGLQYDTDTLSTREGLLKYQAELQRNSAAYSDATIQGQIDLARLTGQDSLEKTKQDISDRIGAVSDRQPAVDELDQIPKDAPDFDQQIADWHRRHLNAINNPATKDYIASELQNVLSQHNQLSSVQLMAKNRTEVGRLLDGGHLPANADYNSVYKDPRLTQQFLIQGHMSEAADDIQSLSGAIQQTGGTLPLQYKQMWEDVQKAWQQIIDNQNDDGYDKIYRGGGAGIVTPDGHLRKDVQAKVDALKGFLVARQAELAKAKAPEGEIKIGAPGALGPEITWKNVIPGTENLYLGQNQFGVPGQAKTGQLTDDLVKAHPELNPFIQDYLANKSPENAAKLKQAIAKAQGYRHGGLVRGYQSGGGVTQYGAGSAGDPATTAATQFLSANTPATGFLGENPSGTGTTDTVPAMLTPGEFVLNKPTVAALGAQNLAAINKIGAQTSPALTPLPGSPLPADTAVAAFEGLARPQDQIQHPDLIKTPQLAIANAQPTPESNTGVQRTLSTGRLPMSNLNNYAYPEGAADVNGIDRNVWANVMSEEGPQFSKDGKHMSVFGLWEDAPGAEGQAYRTIKQYGSNSLPAYQAVTNAWDKLFLSKTQPQRLTSPGMQELVIADSQHAGGGPTLKIIQQMGGWDAINKMNPADAIRQYSALRTHLWPGNQGRVDRERQWALAHDNTLSGNEAPQYAGMQSGGMVNPAYNPQAPVQPLAGLTGSMPTDPLQPMYDPSMMIAAPPQPDLTTTGQVFPPPNRPVYSMQEGGYVPQPGAGFQHGGEVGGLSFGGGGAGSAGGFEGELDQPGGGAAEGQRHRRFHPRVAGQGGMGAQPNIPDPMQKKLAKLSEDFVTGLSSMIKARPELGGAIMQHAKNLMSATGLGDVRTEGTGSGGSDFLAGPRREQQPMMSPAMMAMSGGEGSSSEEAYT